MFMSRQFLAKSQDTVTPFSPVVFLNESRHSLRLCTHVSGETAQIIELSLQTLRRRLSFDKFL